jgi:hypothetical protein
VEKVTKGAFPVLSAVLAAKRAQRIDESSSTIGVSVAGLWLHVMILRAATSPFTLNPKTPHS